MRWLVVPALVVSALFIQTGAAEASHTIVVDQMGDPSPIPQGCSPGFIDCSLRGAILANATIPNAPHTILLAAGTYTLQIAGQNEDNNLTGDLDVSTPMTIQGVGTTDTIVLAGPTVDSGIDRVFHVRGTAALTLARLTISGGAAPPSGEGGGILVDSGATAVLNRVHVSRNAAERGAGIVNNGTLTIDASTLSANTTTTGAGAGVLTGLGSSSTLVTNSTLSGNSAADQGSAVQVSGGSTSLQNVTVTANATRGADANDAGVVRAGGALTVGNSIIAGNTNRTGSKNCGGTVTSLGNNLSSDSTCGLNGAGDLSSTNPKLGPLHEVYNLPPVHFPLPGSPALDAGNAGMPGGGSGACEAVDQTGTPRALDGDHNGTPRCDIGAVEARVLFVDTPADDPSFQACTPAPNDCSLRGAFIVLNLGGPNFSGGVISLPANTYTFDEAGTGEDSAVRGDLDVFNGIVLVGAGADSTIIQAGSTPSNGIDRVLQLAGTGTLYVSNVTIRHGRANDFEGAGGIDARTGWLWLSNVVISQNSNGGTNGGGISGGRRVMIERSTIQGNSVSTPGGVGGGIASVADASITVTDSTIAGNSASSGGGLAIGAANARVTLTSSTISGNSATATGGGGLLMGPTAQSVYLTNVTISGNSAAAGAGGIKRQGAPGSSSMTLQNVTLVSNTSSSSANDGAGLDVAAGAPVTVANSIIANNSNSGGPRNCNGLVTSSGNNLSDTTECPFESAAIGDQEGVPVLLGPLQNNGGSTSTHAPLPGSPAVDSGNAAPPGSGGSACSAVDQRGVARPQNGDNAGAAVCDKGAVEVPNPCEPRPPVTVSATSIGGDLVRAAVNAGAGSIASLHIGAPTAPLNARVSVQGGPQNIAGSFVYNASSDPALPPNTSQLILDIRQQVFGSGTSVPMVVTDYCGPWTTLAGGGTGVFTLPPPPASRQTRETQATAAGPTPVSSPGALVPSPTPASSPGSACVQFPNHAAAQAYLRAHPTDPLNLDSSRNGIACEGADGAGFVNPPLDHTPVPRP